ncbi:hypothetical protein ACLB2K_057330 [Fragaria x ananassa]
MTLFVLLIVPLLSFIFLSSAAYYNLLHLPTMMSFCRKLTPHSLLGLTTTTTTTAAPPTTNENLHHYIPSLTGGLLGLVTPTANDVTHRQPLVLESSSEKKQTSLPPLPSFLPPPATKFPPPISSLNKNGHPNFYLRPVRKDGRLELTEVRIHRPEILRAHREDGRLRLHLISHDQEQEEDNEEEGVDVEDISNVEENVETESSVNDGDQWKMGVAGGEGFRRCHVAGSSHHHHHHHNNHHVWSQQHCVV